VWTAASEVKHQSPSDFLWKEQDRFNTAPNCTTILCKPNDIKIAEVNVKGLFVKLINSSPDKELEIGNHTLRQNVDGRAVSLYRFLPGIIMQANSTVT
ncbi:hypothetical protein Celaphus_00014059, partial [Cervus elaphus hippelaphus]